jgi:hypothetical protein
MTLVKTSLKTMGTFCVLLPSVLMAQTSAAPCADKTGFAKQACEVESGHVSVGSGALNGFKAEPLTTNFSDTIHPDTLPPSIDPKAFAPLSKLPRTDDGAFLLKVGIFEVYAQSYSLDTGERSWARGAAFYPAPIKGRRARIIGEVLKQIELHPDVPQDNVQQLLWVIVQGTDLEKMPAPMQQTAARILPKESLALLQGATATNAITNRLLGIVNNRLSKDKQLQKDVADATGKAKQLDQDYGVTDTVNAVKEASASQTVATAGDVVPRGTWAQMPGGFYVRYLPEGYARVHVQVIVPQAAIDGADPKTPLAFDPTQFLAVHCQTPPQRLGITLRAVR